MAIDPSNNFGILKRELRAGVTLWSSAGAARGLAVIGVEKAGAFCTPNDMLGTSIRSRS